MSATRKYLPPAAADMKVRQNDDDALRLLIAQRRLYRSAKRWLGLRWIGMVVIGIGAPVVSFLWPSASVAAGAVGGVWLFLSRTLMQRRQTTITSQAAAVQEQFDFLIFGMPGDSTRTDLPSIEEIARVAGPDNQLRAVAKKEKLVDWYPIDDSDSGLTAVAIAQRANASYTNSLLKTTATVWSVVVALWIVVLVGATLLAELSLPQFLFGVALPVLPALLDVFDYVYSVRRSATEKHDLASDIEDHLSGRKAAIKPDHLLVWQSKLFELRRAAPEVPDFVYKLTRKRNEHAMHSAANQLSRKAKPQKP